jgi:hypothetical protein
MPSTAVMRWWASVASRATDFALFMVDALERDELIHEAPAIVSRKSQSALTHAG